MIRPLEAERSARFNNFVFLGTISPICWLSARPGALLLARSSRHRAKGRTKPGPGVRFFCPILMDERAGFPLTAGPTIGELDFVETVGVFLTDKASFR